MEKSNMIKTRILGRVAYQEPGTFIYHIKKGSGLNTRKKGAKYKKHREYVNEIKICTKATMSIMEIFYPLAHLCTGRTFAVLRGLCIKIMQNEKADLYKTRSVLFSLNAPLLTNYNVNRDFPFKVILQEAIQTTINRENGTAIINIPELIPRKNIFNLSAFKQYRILFSMGIVEDYM